MLESSFVSDNFNCHHLLRLVVKTLDSLSKWPSTQFVYHLEPVAQVILKHDIVIASLVIKTIIVLFRWRPLNFYTGCWSHKVHLLVTLHFYFLILGQNIDVMKRRKSTWEGQLSCLANWTRRLLRIWADRCTISFATLEHMLTLYLSFQLLFKC